MVSTTGHSSLGLHTAFHVLTRSSGQTVRLTLSPLTRIFRRMRRDKAAPFILGFRLAVWFNLPIPNPSWWIQNRIHVDYVYAGCISPSLLQTMVTHIPIAKLPPRHHTIDQLSSSPNWSLPRGATERQTCWRLSGARMVHRVHGYIETCLVLRITMRMVHARMPCRWMQICKRNQREPKACALVLPVLA